MSQSIGTWEVMVAGVALVVASSTLVSELTGCFTLGAAFCVALLMGFVFNLLLAVSAADLSVAYFRAGAVYDYVNCLLTPYRCPSCCRQLCRAATGQIDKGL